MLPDLLSDYLDEIAARLKTIKNCYIEKYEEEILTPERVNFRARIRFENGYLLELNEAIVLEGKRRKHLNYRYHFQDEQNHLIFRDDDTPHFPNLKTFPHHKHLSDKVISVKRASILDVIEEARQVASGKM